MEFRRRNVARVTAAVAAVVVAIVFTSPVSAARWNFETLDGDGGTNGRVSSFVGDYASAVVWNGQPHVWYHDSTSDDLRHAWWSGAAWNFETLDGNCQAVPCADGRTDRQVGLYTAAAVWNGTPHVWYLDFADDDLRHGWWTGSAWQFETLDGSGGTNGRLSASVGRYNAAAVWNGTPHVWNYDTTNGDLRHGWWTGSAWYFETLDGNCLTPSCPNGRGPGDIGGITSVTVWNGSPHVWYPDRTSGDLRHAWWTGSAWFFETLDGNSATGSRVDGIVGGFSAVTVWNGQPHVWYDDDTNGNLRHAWWTGKAWNFETLDGRCPTAPCANGRIDGDVGKFTAAAVWNGTPHVWHFDVGNTDVRHAWWTGTAWNHETLDGNSTADGRVVSNIGRWNTAIVWNGQPHVWYTDLFQGTLRHAWYG